jgi:Protein of unknown function (DUF3631)
MDMPPPKICRRIRQLFALVGSSNTGEAENARVKLSKLLATHSLSWNDLPAILAATDPGNSSTRNAGSSAQQQAAPTTTPEVNVLDLVLHLIEAHIALTQEQRMAVGLWVLHSYVFGRFPVSPRLALVSPVRGCGKTTLLVLLELLTADAYRTDNTSAAALFHLLGHREHTLLVDEGDNLGLLNNSVLRAVFNAGHRRGGAISRFIGGWSRKFLVFAPLAVAAIGTLPLPLLHRSVVVHMQRRAPGETFQQLDEHDPTFPAAKAEIQKWAATCSLAHDPAMPKLHNRAADNWRVLLAIADDLGHGEAARAAAAALCSGRFDEDPGVVLLEDIRCVFEALGVDRIGSLALVEALLALEDGSWHDWRGPQDDRPPRKLNQSELARLLKAFNIRPRTIWPAQRRPGAKSHRGYLRGQFEEAWAAYCQSADTATQAAKIIHLPRA